MTGRFKRKSVKQSSSYRYEDHKRECTKCGLCFDNALVHWPESKKHEFVCPRCIILNNDPLNNVEQILYEPSILQSKKVYNFKIDFESYSKISSKASYGVEIRTLKLDGEHFYEQTWPDKCSIWLNGKVLKEIDPLNQNSSLKKRRDQKIFNRYMVKNGTNTLSISYKNVKDGKNTKVDFDPLYVFCILLVKKLTVEELSASIVEKNTMTTEESKQFVRSRFSEQGDLRISEIKADLLCKISFTYVKNPVRGVNCTHLDCFSLDYFLKTMEQSPMRKWICPLCRKRCLNLRVDKYFEQIIEKAKARALEMGRDEDDITKVFFTNDADYRFSIEDYEDDCDPAGGMGGGGPRSPGKRGGGGAGAELVADDLEAEDGEKGYEVLSILTSECVDQEQEDEGGTDDLERNMDFVADPAGKLTPDVLFESQERHRDGDRDQTLRSKSMVLESGSDPKSLTTIEKVIVAGKGASDAANQNNRNQENLIHTKNPKNSQNAQNGQVLKKRGAPFSSLTLENPRQQLRITMNQNYRHDNEFLEKFWIHYENEKSKLKNKELLGTDFNQFKSNFLTLCGQDVFFSKKVALLYKFVLNRRKENTNETVMRYNKILDEASGQPNWIIAGMSTMAGRKVFNRTDKGNGVGRRQGGGGKTDTELLKSLLDDYNFEPDGDGEDDFDSGDGAFDQVFGMRGGLGGTGDGIFRPRKKRKGTKNQPIEII